MAYSNDGKYRASHRRTVTDDQKTRTVLGLGWIGYESPLRGDVRWCKSRGPEERELKMDIEIVVDKQ